jgi:hypothetical protein
MRLKKIFTSHRKRGRNFEIQTEGSSNKAFPTKFVLTKLKSGLDSGIDSQCHIVFAIKLVS